MKPLSDTTDSNGWGGSHRLSQASGERHTKKPKGGPRRVLKSFSLRLSDGPFLKRRGETHTRGRTIFRNLGLYPFANKAMAGLRPCLLCRRGAFGVLLLAFMVPRLWAQDRKSQDVSNLSLEELMRVKVELVYGASKYLQKVTAAPASVTLVTSEDIRRYGYRSLGAILQTVPGFFITYDRNYTISAVRGFGRTGDYNSRLLLLVDGHRINDNIYNQALLGTEFPVDVDLIDRVEIIHGPSSSIYGSNAFFAVVNVITKKADLSRGLQAALTGASLDTGYARITYGGQFKRGWQALLSGSFYSSHGPQKLFFQEFDSPETNNGIAQNADRDRFGQFFANLSYKGLRLQAVYGTRQKGIPTASFGTVFNDSREHTTDSRGYVDLAYEHEYRNKLSLSGRVYFDSYIYDGDYPYNYDPEDGSYVTLNHDYVNGAWWGEEVSLSKPLLTHHRFTVGNEYRDNFREKQNNFDVAPFSVYLEDRRASKVWALYAQDEYSIRSNLLLNMGLRHDHESTFGDTTNPRLALIYSPIEKTTLKLLYGTAFRAPNAFELYYESSSLEVGNRKLQPETIRTAEFVVEQYAGDHYRMSGSIFQNRINHLIDQVATPEGLLQFQNVGAVRTTGVQLVLNAIWPSGRSAQINYTYERPMDTLTRSVLHNVPAHLANANLFIPFLSKRLSAGLNLHYASSRRTLAGNKAQGFVLTNLTLSSNRFLGGFELSGSIYNLFDKRYGYLGSDEHRQDIIYQDGRTVRVKLTYTFGGGR